MTDEQVPDFANTEMRNFVRKAGLAPGEFHTEKGFPVDENGERMIRYWTTVTLK